MLIKTWLCNVCVKCSFIDFLDWLLASCCKEHNHFITHIPFFHCWWFFNWKFGQLEYCKLFSSLSNSFCLYWLMCPHSEYYNGRLFFETNKIMLFIGLLNLFFLIISFYVVFSWCNLISLLLVFYFPPYVQLEMLIVTPLGISLSSSFCIFIHWSFFLIYKKILLFMYWSPGNFFKEYLKRDFMFTLC